MKKRRAKKHPERDLELEPEMALQLRPMEDLTLYFPEDVVETTPVILALAPPDLMRCQCEWPDVTHVTFGPKPVARCDQPPSVVAFQKRMRGDTTPAGAMSLCDDHRLLIEHMFPGQLYFRRVTPEQKIGTYVV